MRLKFQDYLKMYISSPFSKIANNSFDQIDKEIMPKREVAF